MHEGDANSGHFFCFIKDHKENKWRKFNDTNIKEVTEEEVLLYSEGGHGYFTAFWVFYISKS